MVSVLYIPGQQPTYIVVVFNGVLRFLSPPWYSIGTVLDNVKDTKEQQIKKTTWLSILIIIQTKGKKNSIEVKFVY